MEYLYFDVLKLGYHLSLAILVGGSFVLGAAAAPAIFRTSRSRAEAGTTFGAVLARYDGIAVLAVVALLLTTVLRATAFESISFAALDWRIAVRWVALVVLAAATLYSSAWASPVARQVRAQTPGFDDLADGAPARREFAQLHRRSRSAMRVAVLAGIVALLFS